MRWKKNGRELFELYDHQADDNETVNLAGNPGAETIVERFSKLLDATAKGD